MTDQSQSSENASSPNSPAGKSRKKLISIIGALVAIVLIAAGLVLTGVVGGDSASAGEIFLGPANDVGPDPYSAKPLASAPDPTLAKPAAATSSTVTAAKSSAITASSGNKPGLYGGSNKIDVCDVPQLVQFLQSNPAKASAWVAALNADTNLRYAKGTLTVAAIPDFISTLTPIVLTRDTRVTNHGYKNGKANPLQYVLQKGTAVLVDKYGVPRVKCYCGNPLLPPVAAKSTPKYKGNVWSDFDPTKVGVVQASPQIIDVFALTDPSTGQTVNRTAGSPSALTVPPASPATNDTTTTVAPGATTTTAAPGVTTTTAAPSAGGLPDINGKHYKSSLKLTECDGITSSTDSCANKDNKAFDAQFTCSDSTTCKSASGKDYKYDGAQWVATYPAPDSSAFTCDNVTLPTTVEIRFSTDANAGIHGTLEQRADPSGTCTNGFLLRYDLTVAAS